MQTSETALLFLQYIMRKLRVVGSPVAGGKSAERGGRAAVVVPNGTLFGDGVYAVIKQELLREFRLHTIVRLPQGVFAPYTDIPANLLFFERGGPTDIIWYYELPLPDGRKKYSKTAPLQFEEFAPALAWWNDRQEGAQAWKVSAAEVAARGYNLDLKNPNAKAGLEHADPKELIASMRSHEGEVRRLWRRCQRDEEEALGHEGSTSSKGRNDQARDECRAHQIDGRLRRRSRRRHRSAGRGAPCGGTKRRLTYQLGKSNVD